MPKVGKAHFPYTPAGKSAAKAASVRTGKPVTKALPSQASATAKARAFGQQGAAKRKAK